MRYSALMKMLTKGASDQPRDDHGRFALGSSRAAAVAKDIRRMHNEHTAKYKAAFAEHGVHMWYMDHNRLMKPDNERRLATTLARLPHSAIADLTQPHRALTVLDGQKISASNRRSLNRKVDAIHESHVAAWQAVIESHRLETDK